MLKKAHSFSFKLSLISRNKRMRAVLCFAINTPKACYLAVHASVKWHAKDDKKTHEDMVNAFCSTNPLSAALSVGRYFGHQEQTTIRGGTSVG